jgi:LPS export ABC transporter protein LptC
MIGRILIGLVVVGAIIGALVLSRGPGASSTQQGQEQASEVPGYSARNAEVVETGADGRPIFTVNARLVRQRPNDDRVQLDGPRMKIVTEEGDTWHVQARSGLIHADGSHIDLFGDVKLNGEFDSGPVVIGTSIISYDTRSEVAHTPAQVTVDSNSGQLAGKGLTANLKDGTVRLESRVHGTFPPK